MEQPRVDLRKTSPELYQTVIKLEGLVTELTKSANIDAGFSHLLRLRASQLNQCAFCVRMHTRDALSCDVSIDRISVVAAWRESQYFSPEERSALALIEAITFVADGQVPDSVYAEAAAVLSDEKIVAIEWIGVIINTWNRIAITSRYSVRPK